MKNEFIKNKKVIEDLKHNKIVICLFVLFGFLIPILIEKYIFPNEIFSIDRYIIFCLIFQFVNLNLFLNIKKLWNFIYKYRYLIGLIIFSFLVINGYHGSSIGMYNNAIEPNSKVLNGETILGKNRDIRSDEWMVTSPNVLSQSSILNDYGNYSNTIMGKKSNVTMFPKLPTKSIFILTTPKFLGYLFLPLSNAFSFAWYFELFALFFATFEFVMIISKKNKILSLFGAVLISFAPAVQWWDSYSIIYSGLLALTLFDYFLKEKRLLWKIIYALSIGLCGAVFIQSMYPAWMIPYAYFYLCIIIWMLYDNKKNYKITDIFILIFVASLVIVGLILLEYIMSKEIFSIESSTVYPGARFSIGGYGWQNLYNYLICFFLPFSQHPNASEASQFISFYPIPLIIGLYYVITNFKSKKNDLL